MSVPELEVEETIRTALSSVREGEDCENSWHEKWTETEETQDAKPSSTPPEGYEAEGVQARVAQMIDKAVSDMNGILFPLMDARRQSERSTRGRSSESQRDKAK